MISECTVSTCIDTVTAAWLFGIPMVCYALGFGIGKMLALVNKMYDAA